MVYLHRLCYTILYITHTLVKSLCQLRRYGLSEVFHYRLVELCDGFLVVFLNGLNDAVIYVLLQNKKAGIIER